MRSKNLLLPAAVLAVFTLSACAGAPAPMPMQGTADDEAALRGLAGRYVAALNANDAAALGAMVTEDYEVVEASGNHLMGRAAFQQMIETDIKARQEAGMMLNISATTEYLNWIDASHAVIGGTYAVSGVPEGAPAKGAWMAVAAKSATGDWQMMSSLGADYLAPPGGAN